VSSDARIGTELAGFRIESVIGRGGMGVVYSAEQLRYGRMVALKLLAPELTHDQQFRERFVHEWRTAARIEHPSIVPIYEAGEAEGCLYIAMRYIDGTDLKTLMLDEGSLAPARTLAILGQVAAALDTVHAHGLVHRDVKPANILLATVAGYEHAYLGDFGVAKRARTESGLTQTGAFIGTVDYAAPEQLEGRSVDGRADVYALGCVLYQCLAGSQPFERRSEAAAISAHLFDPPPSLHAERPDLPGEVDAVIAKALAKAPADRYGTCGELLAAAGEAVSAAEGTAPSHEATASRRGHTAVPGPPTLAAAQVPVPDVHGEPAGPRRRQSRTGILAVVAAVAVVVAVVLGIVLTRGGDDATDAPAAAPSPAPAQETPPVEAEPPPAEAPAGEVAIQLGEAVAPGEPAPGAGEIAAAGEQDVFTFEAAGGEQIFIDNEPLEGGCPGDGLSWKLELRESSDVVFDETMADCQEPFDEEGHPLEQGTYALTVYGVDGGTGAYGFLIAPVTADEFDVAIGDVVAPGEPAEGAGDISTTAELDVYTFTVAGGQRVFLDVQELDGACPGADMAWKLVDPNGTKVFDEFMTDCAEPFGASGEALDGGTYVLTVYGLGGATGTYGFRLAQP
jgi:serine/threonine-protein kinase